MTNYARSIAVLATLCATFPSLLATDCDPLRYRGGVRNSPGESKLNAKQLDAVLTSLRDKAGFLEMRFDENGFLTLGDQTKISGGSATARALINAAVKIPQAGGLESHMYSAPAPSAPCSHPIPFP